MEITFIASLCIKPKGDSGHGNSSYHMTNKPKHSTCYKTKSIYEIYLQRKKINRVKKQKVAAVRKVDSAKI